MPSSASQQERGFIGVFGEMAVEAVVGNVELAARRTIWRGAGSIRGLFVGGANQSSILACSPQKPIGVVLGAVVHFAVFVEGADAGAALEFGWRGIGLFVEDLRVEFLHGASAWMRDCRYRCGL